MEQNSSQYAIDAHNRSIHELGNLSELSKLYSLDVSFNKITSLRNVSTAKELKELKIDNNKLISTKGLYTNLNLESLQMSDNQIEEISRDFVKLGRLKRLWLSSNRIASVQNLQGCRLLVHLNLARNRLQGVVSEGLSALTNLEHLNLTGNQLTSVGNLAHLTKLDELDLSENKLATLQGTMPPNLVVLRVNGNQISDFQGMTGPLDKLNELYAHDNVIADLEALSHCCPHLESVDFRNNQISLSSQLTHLAKCATLQDIWLEGNPNYYSSNYLITVMQVFPELKTLDTFTDAYLQDCRAKIINGTITQEGMLKAAKTHTLSNAVSRLGSIQSMPGPVVTRGSESVLWTPSARIGDLNGTTDEISKAQAEVRDRFKEMKQLLNRIGNGIDNASSPADKESGIEQVNPANLVERHITILDDTNSSPITNCNNDLAGKKGILHNVGHHTTKLASLSTSSDLTHETRRSLKSVQRTRKAQSLIRRSYADAGTDPMESLIGGETLNGIETVTLGCEMETQTPLPPPLTLSLSKLSSYQRGEPEKKDSPEQNNLETTTSDEAIDNNENVEKPLGLGLGDEIEIEKKRFLFQHGMDGSGISQNQTDEYDDEDMNWPDSHVVKTAELRKPPSFLSPMGYRTFRMPSRPATPAASSSS